MSSRWSVLRGHWGRWAQCYLNTMTKEAYTSKFVIQVWDKGWDPQTSA